MCDIGSRIEGKDKIWFVTSAQAKKHMRLNPDKIWADYGGHSGIKLIHPEADGKELEGFPVPAGMAVAINSGKLDELHRKAHLQYVRVNKDGTRHGLCEWFHENGAVLEKLNYKDGELHGLCEWFDGDGKMREKLNYKDGKLHGLCERFYADGKMQGKSNYKDGNRQQEK